MNRPANLDALSPDELRTLAAQLMAQVGEKDRELRYRQTRIDQLTHEIAMLKRLQFGKRSEQFTAEQMSLLDEAIDADLAALEVELEQLQPTPADKQRQKPKRAPLPPHLPRTDIHHEPDDITCSCGCQRVRIGEDISEKLDYTPGVFTVDPVWNTRFTPNLCPKKPEAPQPLSLPSCSAFTQLEIDCAGTSSVAATAATLWPALTSRIASSLNSSV